MTSVIPFDARRFQSAAKHYLSGRPVYPAQLIADVALLCGLSRNDQVLDLGCGPGQLALAFASLAQSVLAVDPEPEMLALCEAQITAAALTNVVIERGSSNDLDARMGSFKLVAIGRAFHWMDRVATLQRLETMVVPAGAVVLFGSEHPKLPDNAWVKEFDAIVEAYAEADPGRTIRKGPDWVGHEAVLLGSRFAQLQRVSVITRYQLTLDQLIDRALSRSSTTAARLGDRGADMVGDIRRHFAARAGAGDLVEIVEAQALIARRPT